MSATKAEYIAASEAAMEAIWIRKFISGLGIVPTINEPIRMFCNNSATLYFANEPGVQKGARHYHRRYHYVRESIALGEIIFLKVHTDDNLADPFTKALPKEKLTQHARSMGLHLARPDFSMCRVLCDENLIMEYLVNISKKARILELKRRYFEDYYSDYQYTVSIKKDTAYPFLYSPKDHKGNKLNTAYPEKLNTPRHFKTLSIDELRSPDFNLFSDQEYSEEEEAETMAKTMEQHMSKTRADYGSGVARPKIEYNDNFEPKGQFLKELRTNTFSGSNHEDANEHVEKVLEIVNLFHIPNITIDQVMLREFPMSLNGATSCWLRNEPTGSIIT
ncbi:hypothetical protein Tco_0010138 [Tanacetum coccineum]